MSSDPSLSDITIDLNPEIVCQLIDKAHEFHAKEGVVLPDPEGDDGDGDWARQILADHADDLTYQELHEAIDELEPDQQVCLVALMWLGRGDYDLSEWEELLLEAGRAWTPRTADYLIGTPMVADYLSEALDRIGRSCG